MKITLFKKGLEFFRSVAGKMMAWISGEKFHWTDLLALVAYGAVVSFGVWHHEAWSDEAYPWIIARDAEWRTFLEIIFTNRDRHPGLFYVVLLPLARLGLPYVAQGLLNAVFAAGAAFLLLARAPFPRAFRYLFLISFYMLYEYAVITRTYMMSVLIIFAIAACYPKRTERHWIYAILVALLFQADFMCLGLGLGLFAVFAWEHRNKLTGNRPLVFSMGIMTLSAVLALWLAHDLPADHPDRGSHLAFTATQCIVPVSKAFLPFMNDMERPPIPLLAMIGSFTALIFSIVALLRKPALLLILGCALAPLFYVFNFVNVGDYRHYGFILIGIVFMLWIAAAYPDESRGSKGFSWCRKARVAAITMMCAFFIFGQKYVSFIYTLEYAKAFSGSKSTAQAIWLLEKQLKIFEQGYALVAQNARAISLMPYLPGVKFWNPCTRSFARYYYNEKTLSACNEVSGYEAILRTKAAWGNISKALFLFEEPLPVREDGDYVYQNIFQSERGFGYTMETFYLYRALPKKPQAFPVGQNHSK